MSDSFKVLESVLRPLSYWYNQDNIEEVAINNAGSIWLRLRGKRAYPWVMYKDEEGETVPAIVSEELWEAANAVFQRRSIDVKHRRNCSTHKNTYTGKLFCTADGAPYYCKDVHYKGTDTSKWVCSHKIKNGADARKSSPPIWSSTGRSCRMPPVRRRTGSACRRRCRPSRKSRIRSWT